MVTGQEMVKPKGVPPLFSAPSQVTEGGWLSCPGTQPLPSPHLPSAPLASRHHAVAYMLPSS